MIMQSQESLEMLVMVSRLLSSKLDISELLLTIMRLASRVVGAERASLYLLDEASQELYFDVALGLPEDVQKMRFKISQTDSMDPAIKKVMDAERAARFGGKGKGGKAAAAPVTGAAEGATEGDLPF